MMIMLLLRLLLFCQFNFFGYCNVCNFENGQTCSLWSFVNTRELENGAAKPSKSDNFRIVVGSGHTNSNHYAYFSTSEPKKFIPMVISQYFQHTSSTCELVFKHQIHGLPGSELLVTTQHLEHNKAAAEFEDNDEEKEDWVRPTFRASYRPVREGQEKWIKSRVSVGQIQFPTRIRIECHSAAQQKDLGLQNVECRVDDIHLDNCNEEVWTPDKCSSQQNKKYLCNKGDQPRCIDYADVCDMRSDCDLDEDEDVVLHRCDQVPPGARCDFELTSDSGCLQWKLQSSNNNDTRKYLRRTSLASSDEIHPHGLPPGEYFHLGQQHPVGSFLFFSTYGAELEQQNVGEVLYVSSISPNFPPTSPKTNDINSTAYKSCLVRFFYCHTGPSTFQLMLEKGAGFEKKEVLWTPPNTSGAVPCSWQKASAVIPYQSKEYRLKLSFGKLYKQPLSVAIDDFSMTPDCFTEESTWSTKYLPQTLKVKSCGKVNGSMKEDCFKEDDVVGDRRTWLVPKDGNYLVQLFGASGGTLEDQTVNNMGGGVIAQLNLKKGQGLGFVVGKKGISPCSRSFKEVILNQTQSNLELMFNNTCFNPNFESDLLHKNLHNLFGTSGGGASAIFIDEKLVVVAGGGGGIMPKVFPVLVEFDSRGGTPSWNSGDQNLKHWAAGHGLAFNPSYKLNNTCLDCKQMAGFIVNTTEFTNYLGGVCPGSRVWTVPGGYGGGGASCGPGAGGGAGFIGGVPGYKNNGQGGTSTILVKNVSVVFKPGVNDGDGKVMVSSCNLRCPTNSSCEFDVNTLEAFCLCVNGKKTEEGGTCEHISVFGLLRNLFKHVWDTELVYLLMIAFFILVLIIGYILFCCCCRQCSPTASFYLKRYKFCWLPVKRSEPDFGSFEMTDTIDSRFRMGDRITPNPIYERLTVMELPQITRHFLQLKHSIGHGAFGEVYEGLFILDGAATKVAVKTLPMESNAEADMDFESEAKLLNHFDHPNIVKFYGVSFEKLPKYIILEYLEGGDLRNFLRDSRPKLDSNEETSNLKMIDLINMALDVAYGCEYLEESKFIHRDIAARNCLLTSKEPGRVVKIADFGMARDIYSSEFYRKGGRAFLAVKWMPPEAFLDGIFNSKTDVWAYGVLLWEIFSMGYMPYTMKGNQEVMQLVVAGGRLEPPVGCPDELYNQMLNCWHTEAQARPSFTEIVNFFTSLASDSSLAMLPVPPILHRQRQTTPSESSVRSSLPLTEDVGTSQATVSTAMTESTTNSSIQSMPTKGEGVSFNVFPPYESRCAKPLMELRARPAVNRDPSLSSHDDSTLHDTCSVKQSPHRIEKDLKVLEAQPLLHNPDQPPSRPPRTAKPRQDSNNSGSDGRDYSN